MNFVIHNSQKQINRENTSVLEYRYGGNEGNESKYIFISRLIEQIMLITVNNGLSEAGTWYTHL